MKKLFQKIRKSLNYIRLYIYTYEHQENNTWRRVLTNRACLTMFGLVCIIFFSVSCHWKFYVLEKILCLSSNENYCNNNGNNKTKNWNRTQFSRLTRHKFDIRPAIEREGGKRDKDKKIGKKQALERKSIISQELRFCYWSECICIYSKYVIQPVVIYT